MSVITINKMNLTTHTTKLLIPRNPKYINIHYTGENGSKKGTAVNTCTYWTRLPKENAASADFVCDDGMITQYTPDIRKYYCYSVGGKRYTNKTTSVSGILNGKDTNKNSISIEICCRKKSTKTINASDPDWYFTEESLNNAILLTRYLMFVFNIPIENVVTHHHVTGKLCPSIWCINEARLSGYVDFINRVKVTPAPSAVFVDYNTQKTSTTTPKTPTKTTTPTTQPITNYVLNGVDLSPVFSATYYADKYPDLKKAFGYNINNLFAHFCKYGMNEGRQAIATFNPVAYRKNYPDLDKAFGDKYIKYYAHYCTNGIKEGRKGL